MAPNTADFPQAYYAVAATGAVVVPVHLLLSPPEVEHVLRDSGASCCCATRRRRRPERPPRGRRAYG